MDSIPYLYINDDSEKTIAWFRDMQVDFSLILKRDTLYLGFAQGLYCLINIGDLNLDGKDEIALSVDYIDESLYNTCRVYSVYFDKWTELKQFYK